MDPALSRLDIPVEIQVSHNRDRCPVKPVFHYHEINEIFLCLTPSMDYLVGSRLYPLNYGDLLIFSSMDIHRPFPPQTGIYERWMVLFRSEFIEGLSTPHTDLLGLFSERTPDFNHHLHLSEKPLQELLALFRTLQLAEKETGYGADVRQKAALAEILLFLGQRYRSVTPVRSAHPSDRTTAMIRYIHSHFQEPLKLTELSASFGLNKNYLNALFKGRTGFTVMQYIIQYRIVKSKVLLRQGYTVTETALECGFSSLSHFTRTFRSLEGCSPGAYKRISAGVPST